MANGDYGKRGTVEADVLEGDEPAPVRGPSPGKRSMSARLVGPAGASPSTGLPGDVRAQLEGAFGVDLGGVRVHSGGASATAAAALGARAFTIGQSIHFGAGYLDPGSAEGRRLIAHETAHTVQQRGAGEAALQPDLEVSTPGDAHEQEAEGFAQWFAFARPSADMTGVIRSVSRPVQPGTVSRAVIQMDGGGGGLGDMALSFVTDRISDVNTLVSALSSVSAAVAQRVIDFVAANKVDILVAFITANPTHALFAYAIRKLPRDKLEELLGSAEAQTAARIVKALAAAGLLALAGPIIFALAPEKAREILRNLDREVITPLFQAAGQAGKDFAKNVLNDVWPVGIGVAMDAGIGATFGYPIYLGADYEFVLSRKTNEVFEFHRRGEMREAFDTGVGVGGFAGTGGGRGRGQGSAGGGNDGDAAQGPGVGAQAGASFQAGLKQIVIQQFQFPVFTDGAFISMLIAVCGADTGATFMIGSLLSSTVAGLDPMHYHKNTKLEFKVYAEGNASAEAGARSGQGTAPDGRQTGSNRDGGVNTGQGYPWYDPRKLLSASIFGQIRAEAGVGFEMDTAQMGSDPATGRPVPLQMKVSIYGEGSAAAGITHRIPILSYLIPQLPQFSAALGIKVTWNVTGPGSEQQGDPVFGAHTYTIYSKTGDMDIPTQAASAAEAQVSLSNMSADTFRDWDSFLDTVVGAKIQRRFGVGAPFARAVLGAAARQRSFSSMLPRDYSQWGITMQGYLEIEVGLSTAQVRRMFELIRDAGTAIANRSLMQLYAEVTTFFSTGTAPAYVTTAFNGIANELLSSLSKLGLHVQVGLKLAAGGQVSAGAKVRLHGSAGAQLTVDRDILAMTGGGTITVEDLKRIILNPGGFAEQFISFDPNELPPAPAD